MTARRIALDATDQQALYVAQSVRDLVTLLEQRRERYRNSRDDDGSRWAVRQDLLDDIDRLSNLINLLQSLPDQQVHSATRAALNDCLGHVRKRISMLGTTLTLDKIRELRSLAEYPKRCHEHPWGKSYLLKEHFVRHLTNLHNLADSLSRENAEDLRSSAVSINALIESERRCGLIPSFAGEPDIAPIAMEDLTFGIINEEAGPPSLRRA